MSAGVITRVRLFIDRAAITRRLRFDEAAAAAEAVFAPIPLDCDTSTLRAEAWLDDEAGERTALSVTGVTSAIVFAEQSSERQQKVAQQAIGLRCPQRLDSHLMKVGVVGPGMAKPWPCRA